MDWGRFCRRWRLCTNRTRLTCESWNRLIIIKKLFNLYLFMFYCETHDLFYKFNVFENLIQKDKAQQEDARCDVWVKINQRAVFLCVLVTRQSVKAEPTWFPPSSCVTVACWGTSAASPPTCNNLTHLSICTSHDHNDTDQMFLSRQIRPSAEDPSSALGVRQRAARQRPLPHVFRGGESAAQETARCL